MSAQNRGQPIYMAIAQALQLTSRTIIKIVITEFTADYIVKRGLANMIWDSGPARFTTALLGALFITSATFVPFVVKNTVASPLATPQPYPHAGPKPRPLPNPQAGPPLVDGIYPDPEPCRGNCSWIHDPSIWYEDGTYWRFSTSGNIAIATAPSLGGPWRYKGALLHNGTSIFVVDGQDIWAPSVTKRGDMFYCHYSVSRFGLQNSSIGVATSHSLEPGSWQDHGSIGLPLSHKYNLIDPFVFQEAPDSPIFFTFGSYWQDIFQVELFPDDDITAFGDWAHQNGRIVNIIRNNTLNALVVEGAIMHKEKEFYYLFYSVGHCCNTPQTGLAPDDQVYHIVVCRSEMPKGPFYDRSGRSCLEADGGTTILASHGDVYAPGGQGVMMHPENGRTVMYYHYGKVDDESSILGGC
ncbi:glycoside hydrolase family 43 protein [Bipolaris maydis C5]|uniref:Endo-1,5-alpha-L-arabinanase A n=1 Tax=Cochliobolus heterostrophus (strain C5 / ATCC 48332 / race O) TaxID=701091 RepID=M2UEM4_COCH5|nr:glycoside hydrolase family 43 protein [Bipolaris maydis C5]KAJ5028023.1 glycoside hydrolase family 43 protein [Bipolaris maydis]KAJ6265360.1 glycoside hydrolase family 43 protein [Bipolaris maydis]